MSKPCYSPSVPNALFTPLKLGTIALSHRIIMAPLTRLRATAFHVPSPLAEEYFIQRACVPGTLIITEGTLISLEAGGYPNVPGIWNQSQISAWKEIVDSVHAKGCFMFLQLWALGRAAMPAMKEAQGTGPVQSSSAVPIKADSTVPVPLTNSEIKEYTQFYAQAAKNAMEAGFDGVEIHAANGYLIDQFTQDKCNRRDDEWGGNIENRSKFVLEVTRAVVNAIGAEKVGIRFSPWSKFNGMRMEDPVPQFTHILQEMKGFGLAYVHFVESRVGGDVDQEVSSSKIESLDPFIEIWRNASPILIAGGHDAESAMKVIDEQRKKGREVAVAFGRKFISNPDLVFRIKGGIALTPHDRDTFYDPMIEKGYTDYECSKEWLEQKRAT